MISLQILFFFACVRVIKGQSMCDAGNTTTTVFPPEHAFLSPSSAKSSCRPDSLSLSLSRYRIGPELFFGPGRTWQDRPWPVLFMLAHGNAIWLVWMITTATAGWPAASRNQGHSTSALRTFPALFSSACRWIIHPVQPQRHESTAQTPPYPQKKLHTQFTDIITCNEKINVSAWTAKINSSQMSSDISQGCGSYTGEDGGTSCSDFTRPGKTGSDHDWMRNKWINWFLTHVARRCHIWSFTGACWQPRGS